MTRPDSILVQPVATPKVVQPVNEWLINILIPLVTISESNAREHWSRRARRVRAQREAVAQRLRRVPLPPTRAVEVRLTRVSPRALDDDNLRGALKSVRDAVAMWLGVGDGPTGPIVWTYGQEKAPARHGSFRGVGIQIGTLAHGADGGRDENAPCSADVPLDRETSCNGAQAEPLGAQLMCPAACGLLLRIDHEDAVSTDGMTERRGPERLASTPLQGHGPQDPPDDLGSLKFRYCLNDASEQCRLRSRSVPDPIRGVDHGPCAAHAGFCNRRHEHATGKPIGLVNREDARAMRAEILQCGNEARPIGHTRPARDAVLVHGDKLHTFTARPFGEGFPLH
jgi:hypothetical protein